MHETWERKPPRSPSPDPFTPRTRQWAAMMLRRCANSGTVGAVVRLGAAAPKGGWGTVGAKKDEQVEECPGQSVPPVGSKLGQNCINTEASGADSDGNALQSVPTSGSCVRGVRGSASAHRMCVSATQP